MEDMVMPVTPWGLGWRGVPANGFAASGVPARTAPAAA